MTNSYNHNQLSPRLQYQLSNLSEGLEAGDLERLVTPKVSIDEYKSKMGSDEEIVVVSFQVSSKEPALDIVNFIEKSYEWVADADVSSGEVFDGSYIVFVEIERNSEVPEHLIEMFEDLSNLTEHSLEDWSVEYFKPRKNSKLDLESLTSIIPLTPESYRNLVKSQQTDLDKLKTAAGVKVDTKAPKNDFTEGIRTLAGIYR
jgi:hypothetical protein